MPEPWPETGFCVHKLVMAAGEPEHLYQQNHCGVYRSLDGGVALAGDHRRRCPPTSASRWSPTRATRRTAWVIPLTAPDKGRYMPDGRAAVWRTHDGGDTWTRGDDGLPRSMPTWASCARRWPATSSTRSGSTSATSTGQLYASADGGDDVVGHRTDPAADLLGRGDRRG